MLYAIGGSQFDSQPRGSTCGTNICGYVVAAIGWRWRRTEYRRAWSIHAVRTESFRWR